MIKLVTFFIGKDSTFISHGRINEFWNASNKHSFKHEGDFMMTSEHAVDYGADHNSDWSKQNGFSFR